MEGKSDRRGKKEREIVRRRREETGKGGREERGKGEMKKGVRDGDREGGRGK